MDQSTISRDVGLTERAARRIAQLKQMEGNEQLMLRISVASGGCSGFSSVFLSKRPPATATACSSTMAKPW